MTKVISIHIIHFCTIKAFIKFSMSSYILMTLLMAEGRRDETILVGSIFHFLNVCNSTVHPN